MKLWLSSRINGEKGSRRQLDSGMPITNLNRVTGGLGWNRLAAIRKPGMLLPTRRQSDGTESTTVSSEQPLFGQRNSYHCVALMLQKLAVSSFVGW